MANTTLTQTGAQVQADLNKVEGLANIKSVGSGLTLSSAGELSASGGGSSGITIDDSDTFTLTTPGTGGGLIAFGAIARGFFYPATTQIFTPIKCVAIMFGSGFINSVTIRSISGSLYTTDGTQITLSNINDQTDKLLILGSDVTIGWKFS